MKHLIIFITILFQFNLYADSQKDKQAPSNKVNQLFNKLEDKIKDSVNKETYVLVSMIQVSEVVDHNTQEFNTKERCEEAKHLMEKYFKDVSRLRSFCTLK